MDHGTLDDPLKACRRLGILAVVKHQTGQLIVDIALQVSLQNLKIDIAGPHNSSRIGIVDQSQQQMFKRGIFVASVVCH